jgi:phosphoglucosamine mutase
MMYNPVRIYNRISYKDIFGTDGIRSVAGKFPLKADDIRRIGFAAGNFLLEQQPPSGSKNGSRPEPLPVIIGKDTRASGNWIEKALSEGLSSSGCKILSCGVIPTSAIATLLTQNHFLAGAVISASHNPPSFNGIKFFTSSGKKLPDDWEREIEKRAERLNPLVRIKPFMPIEDYPQAQSLYLQFLKKNLPPKFSLKGLKWVLDCANGSASPMAADLFRSLGAKVIVLHDRPNGTNINLNCGTLHPRSLQLKVLREKAHGGCAFDGDADRVLFVNEKGRLMNGDVLLGMAAGFLKKKNALAKNCVVTTVMANFGLIQYLKQQSIRVITTAVGDRAVADALQSSGAMLGGEQAGHIIFRKFLPTGDGLLTALMILNIMKQQKHPLSFYNELFPKFPQILLNLKVKEKIPIESCHRLQQTIEDCQILLGKNGRVLVRYSGTEPLLRIMLEGSSKAQIKRLIKTITKAARMELDARAF